MTLSAMHVLDSDGYDADEGFIEHTILCPLDADGLCPDSDHTAACAPGCEEHDGCYVSDSVEDFAPGEESPFATPGQHPFRIEHWTEYFGEHDARFIHLTLNSLEGLDIPGLDESLIIEPIRSTS